MGYKMGQRGGMNYATLRDEIRSQAHTNDPVLCDYCGDPAETVDHVHPVTLGGDDHPSNLVPACRACNGEKWHYTLSHWAIARSVNGKAPRKLHSFELIVGLSQLLAGEAIQRGLDAEGLDLDALKVWYSENRDAMRETHTVLPFPGHLFRPAQAVAA